jgi:GH25 family lysozyme M1 (1,4-beta-N-acetylmuramidase)
MVLLHEAISGRSHIGAKDFKSHKEILLFCNLNSIYSGIDLKLWNMKENINDIFFDIPKFQKNQVSQLLVHATAL